MLSTPKLKPNDDPHDVLVVAPDVALVVPTDEELSKLAHTFRHPSAPQIRTGSDLPAGATVPPVDATFRPAVSDVRVPGPRRAARVFMAALLMAGCAGAAAYAWQSYGDVARQMIAQWTPQRILTSLLPLETSAPSAQPIPPPVETVTANAAPPQPAAQAAPQPTAPTQAAPPSAALAAPQGVAPSAADPSVESAQSVRAMGHDLANAGQEIEQLKASIEQLKVSIEQLTAGQQQMSRDIAKASEQNLRPKIVPPPRRPPLLRERRSPPPLSRPQATLAPMSTQAAAPYVPRRPEPAPQDTGEPLADPELASVPRPPMPLR
jgi:hypothetical protein